MGGAKRCRHKQAVRVDGIPCVHTQPGSDAWHMLVDVSIPSLQKREVEKSLDFIHSICEDIKTKKEKICLANRINKLHDCINSFLETFEKGP